MAETILDSAPGFVLRAKPITEAMRVELTASAFWDSVSKSDGCWTWKGATNNKGYGRFKFQGASYGAHRLAFVLGKDTALPGSVLVCHRCDNRRCVNPAHLFLGTIQDNNQDMTDKGRARAPLGLRNGRGKLSPEDIQAIRESAERQVDLCIKYGVSDGHISRIKSGERRARS